MPEFIEISEIAARAGGKILVDMLGRIQVREKGPNDLVTEADIASQTAIRKIVLEAFPEHAFCGEETLATEGDSSPDPDRPAPSGYRWYVDPLDGTTNYVHQLPSYSVSIALVQGERIIAGTVYDPCLDECFSAVAGEGARLNGQRLRASGCTSIDKSLVATSLPAKVERDSVDVCRLLEVIYACRAVRRLGSAALNLCYLAAGRFDAYWATNVKTWDIAAGMLMLLEAGGVVTDMDGGPFDLQQPKFAAAATHPLHRELLDVLGRAGN